jgi:UMF1 family MFS transporter
MAPEANEAPSANITGARGGSDGPGAPHREKVYDRAGVSWALFEAARNPYVILVSIYIFAPYFAQEIAGGGPQGQALVASIHKVAGVIVACTAPLLGAAADKAGHRKPYLAAAVCLMAPIVFSVWWVRPDEGLPLAWAYALMVAAAVAFNYTEVLHNSMLPLAAKPRALPHISGLGLASGNAAAVLALVFVFVFLALPGYVDWSFVPKEPVFGLSREAFEPSRIVAPIAAVMLIVFAIPLFLFVPDAPATGVSWPRAFQEGVASVWATIRSLRAHKNLALFLAARMLFADGKGGIVVFGGVFAAGVMGWGLLDMAAYGIWLSLWAVLGGFLGGWLDHWLGAKRAIILELLFIIASLIALVSVSPTGAFWLLSFPPGAPSAWQAPLFETWPDLIFLAVAAFAAVAITAAYASARTMITQLAPAQMAGQIFGLYALSGTATFWLAPWLVEGFTRAYDSQAIGLASILILLVSGLGLLLFVKAPQRQA